MENLPCLTLFAVDSLSLHTPLSDPPIWKFTVQDDVHELKMSLGNLPIHIYLSVSGLNPIAGASCLNSRLEKFTFFNFGMFLQLFNRIDGFFSSESTKLDFE